jgi:hypothetical protein
MKYDLSILSAELFKLNQHKFFPPCFFCSFFRKKKVSCWFSLKKFIHFFFIHIFIHKYHSSMNMWQNILPHEQIFVLCVKFFLKNILLTWAKYSSKIFDCAQLLVLMLAGSWNSIPPVFGFWPVSGSNYDFDYFSQNLELMVEILK